MAAAFGKKFVIHKIICKTLSFKTDSSFLPCVNDAANPVCCVEKSETNLTYNWFPLDSISSGFLSPHKKAICLAVESPPSLISI